MPKHRRKKLFAAALCLIALPRALAQSATPAPAAPAVLEHRSAFEGYRPFAAEEVQPWRQSNDTVRDIGGWRVYAREISGANAPAAALPKSGPAPAAPGPKPAGPPQPVGAHGGHAK